MLAVLASDYVTNMNFMLLPWKFFFDFPDKFNLFFQQTERSVLSWSCCNIDRLRISRMQFRCLEIHYKVKRNYLQHVPTSKVSCKHHVLSS